MLTTKLIKWGNSYGIRLPKQMLELLNLKENQKFTVKQMGSAIMLNKVEPKPDNEFNIISSKQLK